jgi:hypothetical protein
MLTAKEVLGLAALLLVGGLLADSALACSYVNEAAARANSVWVRRRRAIGSSAVQRHIDNLRFSSILDILLEIAWNLGAAHGQYRAKESAAELPKPAGQARHGAI